MHATYSVLLLLLRTIDCNHSGKLFTQIQIADSHAFCRLGRRLKTQMQFADSDAGCRLRGGLQTEMYSDLQTVMYLTTVPYEGMADFSPVSSSLKA